MDRIDSDPIAFCRAFHRDRLAHDPDPGVRHHHVQTSKAPLGGVDHTQPALLEADVLMEVERLAAIAADPLHQCLTPRIVEVGYDHLCAFTRESCRAGCANSRRAARYDGYFTLHLAHSVLRRSCAPHIVHVRFGRISTTLILNTST